MSKIIASLALTASLGPCLDQPAGYGHAMMNTGNEDLEIIQTWDAGKFEEITP